LRRENWFWKWKVWERKDEVGKGIFGRKREVLKGEGLIWKWDCPNLGKGTIWAEGPLPKGGSLEKGAGG
jgi:hypothetical protein